LSPIQISNRLSTTINQAYIIQHEHWQTVAILFEEFILKKTATGSLPKFLDDGYHLEVRQPQHRLNQLVDWRRHIIVQMHTAVMHQPIEEGG
jgi:hypothetical protein